MQSKPPTETEEVISTAQQHENGDAPTPPVPPVVATPVVPVTPPAEDYRAKFGFSTRENQVLQGQLAELNKTLGEITREEIPTDEEMKSKYPEFEYAEPLVQNMLKRQEVQDRRLNKVQLGVGNLLGSVQHRNELAGIVATNPALKGKEQQFLDFATDPKRANAPVETLVSAFLFEVKDETPAPAPTPVPVETPAPAARPHASLERGTPTGGEMPSTTTERTPEELQALRTSNPKEYNRLIQTGKI